MWGRRSASGDGKTPNVLQFAAKDGECRARSFAKWFLEQAGEGEERRVFYSPAKKKRFGVLSSWKTDCQSTHLENLLLRTKSGEGVITWTRVALEPCTHFECKPAWFAKWFWEGEKRKELNLGARAKLPDGQSYSDTDLEESRRLYKESGKETPADDDEVTQIAVDHEQRMSITYEHFCIEEDFLDDATDGSLSLNGRAPPVYGNDDDDDESSAVWVAGSTYIHLVTRSEGEDDGQDHSEDRSNVNWASLKTVKYRTETAMKHGLTLRLDSLATAITAQKQIEHQRIRKQDTMHIHFNDTGRLVYKMKNKMKQRLDMVRQTGKAAVSPIHLGVGKLRLAVSNATDLTRKQGGGVDIAGNETREVYVILRMGSQKRKTQTVAVKFEEEHGS